MYNKIVIESTSKKIEIILLHSETIYFKYLGYFPKVGTKYLSCFNDERTPSMSFRVKNNQLLYKCFSSGNTGNCIGLVSLLENKPYVDCVDVLYKSITRKFSNRKLNKVIKASKEQMLEDTKPYTISVILKEFTEYDYNYWYKFYIDKRLLEKYNIKPIQEAYLDSEALNNYLWYKYKNTNPCYRYLNNGKVKLYKPLEKNKNKKWRSSYTIDTIEGFKYLDYTKDLIITKSYKDIIVINEYSNYTAISLSNERVPTEKIINWLKSKFENIYILFDNDETGIKFSNQFSKEYNIPNIFIPLESECKDASEYINLYGIEELSKSLNKLIKQN